MLIKLIIGLKLQNSLKYHDHQINYILSILIHLFDNDNLKIALMNTLKNKFLYNFFPIFGLLFFWLSISNTNLLYLANFNKEIFSTSNIIKVSQTLYPIIIYLTGAISLILINYFKDKIKINYTLFYFGLFYLISGIGLIINNFKTLNNYEDGLYLFHISPLIYFLCFSLFLTFINNYNIKETTTKIFYTNIIIISIYVIYTFTKTNFYYGEILINVGDYLIFTNSNGISISSTGCLPNLK